MNLPDKRTSLGNSLHSLINQWLDGFRSHTAGFITVALDDRTIFHLDDLVNASPSTSQITNMINNNTNSNSSRNNLIVGLSL